MRAGAIAGLGAAAASMPINPTYDAYDASYDDTAAPPSAPPASLDEPDDYKGDDPIARAVSNFIMIFFFVVCQNPGLLSELLKCFRDMLVGLFRQATLAAVRGVEALNAALLRLADRWQTSQARESGFTRLDPRAAAERGDGPAAERFALHPRLARFQPRLDAAFGWSPGEAGGDTTNARGSLEASVNATRLELGCAGARGAGAGRCGRIDPPTAGRARR